MAALKKAQKAQAEAPVYRMKMLSMEPNDKTSAMTVEFVKPDSLYWKTEENGRVTVEMWSDGKKTYMRQGSSGEVHESPIDVNSLVTQARQVDPLETLIARAQILKFMGHEKLNEVDTSVYTFKSNLMNTDSSVKIWVSDVDHRPLKSEVEMQRGSVRKKMVISYEYGSSIKIIVPTK